MSENFNKLKKFFTRYTAVKCAVCGISLGLFISGAVLLILKLCAVNISPWYYVLIGAAVAAAAGAALYFILRPTEKKIAKRLDAEYGLNERVQTMLEYRGSENEVAVIQREVTNARLGTVKTKLRVTEILKQTIAPVLACAMLATAIAVPARISQAEPEDPPYEVTEDQYAALRQLIKDVKDSYMESNLKASVAAVLEGLLDSIDLEEGEEKMTDSEMTATVCSAVAVIDGLIAAADSYITLGTALKKSENLENLGSAILGGVTSYKADNSRIRTLTRVNEKSEVADEDINSALTDSAEKISEHFDELDGDDLKSALVSFCEIFKGLLKDTGYAEKNDALYKVLETLCADLEKVSSNVGNGYKPSALRTQIADAGNKMVEDGTTALGVQAYNCMMDEFIRECLSAIFKISLAEFPSNTNVVYNDPGSDNPGGANDPNDDVNNGGGSGDGDTLYGSNDIIYFPAEDEYIEYGKVLNDYYKAVVDHLDSNNVPEEYRQFITNYFNILYSGIKE